MPRVTVVMATYNWATVLPFSIGSVLDQTYDDFELLVVGDGCTDESADVVGGIPDRRVRWIDLRPNCGSQFGPNNHGIEQAAGEVIAYVGHDDLWLPWHLELLVDALDSGARIAHGTVLMVDANGRAERWPRSDWRFRAGDWIPPTSMVHDRAVALSVGGWRAPWDTGELDPEADLWRRIGEVAGPPSRLDCVTSIKFPAAVRRDVYRDRPCHEQRDWLVRSREHDGPADAFGRTCPEAPVPARAGLVDRLRAGAAVRTRLARAGLGARPGRPTAEARRQANRRIKGLD